MPKHWPPESITAFAIARKRSTSGSNIVTPKTLMVVCPAPNNAVASASVYDGSMTSSWNAVLLHHENPRVLR
jgi:hypothetical protein